MYVYMSLGRKAQSSKKEANHLYFTYLQALVEETLFSTELNHTFTTKCCFILLLILLTARSPIVRPPLINSHSFMQTLTNQMWRTVSSWLLIGLNLYERMWINQKWSHFWAPCCNRPFAWWCHFTTMTRILASDWIKSVCNYVNKSKAVTLLGSLL